MVLKVSLAQAALGINAADASHEQIIVLNFGSQIVVGGGEGGGVVTWSEIVGKPELSAVALSGDYEDLTSRPELSAVALSGEYDHLEGKPTDSEGYVDRSRRVFNSNDAEADDLALWVGTEDEYDAIEAIDSSTLYFII